MSLSKNFIKNYIKRYSKQTYIMKILENVYKYFTILSFP